MAQSGFPQSLLVHTLSFLDVKVLALCLSVAKNWKKAGSEEVLWRPHVNSSATTAQLAVTDDSQATQETDDFVRTQNEQIHDAKAMFVNPAFRTRGYSLIDTAGRAYFLTQPFFRQVEEKIRKPENKIKLADLVKEKIFQKSEQLIDLSDAQVESLWYLQEHIKLGKQSIESAKRMCPLEALMAAQSTPTKPAITKSKSQRTLSISARSLSFDQKENSSSAGESTSASSNEVQNSSLVAEHGSKRRRLSRS